MTGDPVVSTSGPMVTLSEAKKGLSIPDRVQEENDCKGRVLPRTQPQDLRSWCSPPALSARSEADILSTWPLILNQRGASK